MFITGQYPLRKILMIRPEGSILAVGVAIILTFIFWLAFSWLKFPHYCQNIISLFATRLLVGRPGGVYFGHVLALDYLSNITVNMFVDVVAVLLLYPLFVFMLEHIVVFHPLKSFVESLQKTARRNYKFIKSYGSVGLFLFVLFPLWGTGPVIGFVIGYMMGLRPWANMAVVLSATFLAIVLWVVTLSRMHLQLMAYSAYMPMVVIGVFFAIAVGVHLVRGVRGGESKKREVRREK